MRIKKFLTILLTIAMVVSLLPATAFAANNTATTMRLAKTQGAVAVTNATGKKVTQTANMKLYNGYKMKTGAKSYAWISLDDTKVAKLDANSSVEVQKSGKALTLFVSSGNLFFNVKNPLKSGETFSIKTSTMTTGIRGTSGCVRVISDRVTEVHLLTGQVQIYTEHPALDVHKTATLQAGQKATSLIDWEAMAVSGEMAEIVIERLENHEVCGICSKEIEEDPALLERIEEEAPHLLPERAADEADERLAADEAEAEAKQEEIDQAVEEQVFPEDVDPYFEEEAGGGGGGSSAVVETTNVIEVTDWQEFVDALVTFSGTTENTEIRLMNDILPDADVTTMPSVENDTGSGAKLTINLQDYGLNLPQPLVNNSNLTIKNQNGYITAKDPGTQWFGSWDIIQNNGTLNHTAGTIQIPGGFTGVLNNGVYNMSGTASFVPIMLGDAETMIVTPEQVDCSVYNAAGATFDMNGGSMEIYNSTGIKNEGTVNLNGGEIVLRSSDLMGASHGYLESADYGDTAVLTVNGTTFTVEEDIVAGDGERGDIAAIRIDSGEAEIKNTTMTIGSGYGIAICGSGTASMTDGSIEVTGSIDAAKGAVFNCNTFDMTGGEIQITPDEGMAIGETFAYYGISGSKITFGGNAAASIDVDSTSISEMEEILAVFMLEGDMKMTGGTINVNGDEPSGVITNGGSMTMTGGTINVNDGGVGVRNGSYDIPGELSVNGGAINVNGSGTGIWGIYGKVALKGGTVIALHGGVAANLENADLLRPIGRNVIKARRNSGQNETAQLLTAPIDNFISESVEEYTDSNGTLVREATLVDTWGSQAADATVSDAAAFIQAIAAFNNGAGNSTITLNADVDLSPVENPDGSMTTYPQPVITNTASVLTIDLNGNTLTLQDPVSVDSDAELEIKSSTEGGTVAGAANPLITNYGKLNISSGTLNPSYDAVWNMGDVSMTGGVINVPANANGGNTYGIKNTNGRGMTVSVTGGVINVAGGTAIGDEGEGLGSTINIGGTADINLNGEGNGIDSVFGTVNITGGTIDIETAMTRKAVYGYYSTINMSGGTITVGGNGGNYGIYGEYTYDEGEAINLTDGTITVIAGSSYAVGANQMPVVLDGTIINANSGDGITLRDADMQMLSGTVNVQTGNDGIYVGGTSVLTMKGGTVSVVDNDLTVSPGTNGVQIGDSTAGFVMESGTITVSSSRTEFPANNTYYAPNGLKCIGTATLKGGSITATGDRAQAVNITNGTLGAAAVDTVIKATADDRLWVGTMPADYEIAADGNYYKLQEKLPTAYIVEVSSADELAGVLNSQDSRYAGNIVEVHLDSTISLAPQTDENGEEVTGEYGQISVSTVPKEIILRGNVDMANASFLVGSGANLTVDSGTYTGGDNSTAMFINQGGTLTINSADLYVTDGGIGIWHYDKMGAVTNVNTGTIEVPVNAVAIRCQETQTGLTISEGASITGEGKDIEYYAN